MTNPYFTPPNVDLPHSIFAEDARLTGTSFLFRKIEFQQPFQGTLVYSGWWFWQRIHVCEQRVWARVSWATIDRQIEFKMPDETGFEHGRIEIDFSRGLMIRRFRVWMDDALVFEHIK